MIDNPMIWFTILPLGAYLIGSIPFGVILGKIKGVDIRKVGSGNVGATNVGRVLGRRWGYTCFLLDMVKGFLPSFITGVLIGAIRFGEEASESMPTIIQQVAWLITAGGAIMGHVFNVWLGFRGGKGVATSLGAGFGVFPYFTLPALLGFSAWMVVVLISRYVSLASIIGCSSFLPFFVLLHLKNISELWLFTAFSLTVLVLVNVTHRGNIKRLLAGTENKIGEKNKPREHDLNE